MSFSDFMKFTGKVFLANIFIGFIIIILSAIIVLLAGKPLIQAAATGTAAAANAVAKSNFGCPRCK